MTNGDGLSQLLQQSIELTNGQQTFLDLMTQQPSTSLQRPLDQLEQQSRQLWQKSSRSSQSTNSNSAIGGATGILESKAQILLAQQGVDAEKILQTLNAIEIAQAFEPLQPLEDTDVEGFLQNEHELILCRAVDALKEEMFGSDVEQQFERSIRADWERARKSIFDSLAHERLSTSQASQSIGHSVGQSSVSGGFGSAVGSSVAAASGINGVKAATEQMTSYSQAVCALNDSRLQNKTPQLAKIFKECAATDQLRSTWDLLATIIGESSSGPAASVAASPAAPGQKLYPSASAFGSSAASVAGVKVGERSFARGYAAAQNDPESIALRKRLLGNSSRWLERIFCQFLDDHVTRILKQPPNKLTPTAKVQMWTRDVLLQQPGGASGAYEVVDGHPFWATMFYLLRMGCQRDALEFAGRYEKYLAKSERRFLDYLTAWCTSADRTLGRKLQMEIVADFNTRIRDGALRMSSSTSGGFGITPVSASSSRVLGVNAADPSLFSAMSAPAVDPYKYLLFRLLGRILLDVDDDFSIPPAIVRGLVGGRLGWEDDLWLQLQLVREDLSSPYGGVGGSDHLSDVGGVGSSLISSVQQQLQLSYTLNDVYTRHICKLPVAQWTSDGQSPLRYFQILLLVGQFERAIQFLISAQFRPLEIDAVHFCICLAFYGLLHIPDESLASMDSSSDIASVSQSFGSGSDQPHVRVLINFGRVLQLYLMRLFTRAANPQAAAHYSFLLCLFSDGHTGDRPSSGSSGSGAATGASTADQMKQLCHQWLVDLVLETGRVDEFFGTLSGSTSAGGTHGVASLRQPGFLDRYLPLIDIHGWDQFRRLLIQPAAVKAETAARNAALGSGEWVRDQTAAFGSSQQSTVIDADWLRHEQNALMLYNLAEDYAAVLQILSRRLSQNLSQNSFDQLCDSIFGVLKRSSLLTNVNAAATAYLDSLQRSQSAADQALGYYLARPHIASSLPAEHRKTLSTLVHLSQFYKCVYECSLAFIAHLSVEQGYASTPATSVRGNPSAAGYSMRLEAGGSGALASEWRRGLSILDELGFLPAGFSRHLSSSLSSGGTGQFQDDSFSVMGTPAPASRLNPINSPYFSRTPGSVMGTPGQSSGSRSDAMHTGDFDYSRIASKADGLRREFSDMVLSHLPELFLGAEMLILIGWYLSNSSSGAVSSPSSLAAVDLESGRAQLAKKSRQLISFVSAVTRWFKVPPETHRKLASIDELMIS